METRVYVRTDRAEKEWPAGPWDKEPDKVQWQDEATGFPCLAVRSSLGAWCGYVGIFPGHPYYKKDVASVWSCDVGRKLKVHGGCTFSGHCQETVDEAHGVCHVSGPGEEPNVWWIGFDCAHTGDLVPSMLRYAWTFEANSVYRTLEYVKTECGSLAKQLQVA